MDEYKHIFVLFIYSAVNVPIICKIPSFLSQFWRSFEGGKVVWYEFMRMLHMTNKTHLFQNVPFSSAQISLQFCIFLLTKSKDKHTI